MLVRNIQHEHGVIEERLRLLETRLTYQDCAGLPLRLACYYGWLLLFNVMAELSSSGRESINTYLRESKLASELLDVLFDHVEAYPPASPLVLELEPVAQSNTLAST